jgi:hypothetical protein
MQKSIEKMKEKYLIKSFNATPISKITYKILKEAAKQLVA